MPTTTTLEDFAAAVDHAFSLTPVARTVSAGGARLRLAFADDATADSFVSAFAPAGEGPLDLSIAVVLAPDRLLETLIPPQREVFVTSASGSIYACWQPIPGECLQIYHAETRRGVLWVPTGQAIESVRSRPALPILHAYAAATGWSPVHAAAVGLGGRFLLLAGPSGSGKSTAAVACAAAGWDYAGDDFVMVDPVARRIEPIYASARLRPGAAGLLDSFVTRTQVAVTYDYGDARNELRLGKGYADIPIKGGAIAAILLPRRSGEAAFTVRPARPIETYQAMVGVTIVQLPGLRDAVVPKLLKLATAVPAFVIDTGSVPADVPAALRQFLAGLPP